MTAPAFAPLPASLSPTVPFVGPEEAERQRGARYKARLGANELTFAPSEHVLAALAAAAQMGEGGFYPDPHAFHLTNALAEHHGVAAERILVGEGIDGLLGLCARLYLGPDDAAITSDGAYPTFNYHVAGLGARLVKLPYRDDAEDFSALADAARREGARLLYVSNPDNPMGSWWEADAIMALLDAAPPDCMVLLDEAYAEFAPDGTAPAMVLERPNLIRLRTFSKAYGLAGIRVGYAIGPAEAIAAFGRFRNHFGVNRLGQFAAVAALEDQAYLEGVVARVALGRERLSDIATANGLKPLPAATNFVTMDCGADGAFAGRVLDEVLKRDVFIRMPGSAPLNRCIRVSVGREDELDLFEAVLPEALAAARG